MKANLICGILAINLLALDKALECFKQLDFDDDQAWHEEIASDDDLAFYGLLLVLTSPNYDIMKETVLFDYLDEPSEHQDYLKDVIPVQTDNSSFIEEGVQGCDPSVHKRNLPIACIRSLYLDG